MKVIAVVGLLFYIYCAWRILSTWNHRDRLNKSIWFVFLGLFGGLCIGLLGRWGWIPVIALLLAMAAIAVWWFVHLISKQS